MEAMKYEQAHMREVMGDMQTTMTTLNTALEKLLMRESVQPPPISQTMDTREMQVQNYIPL